MTTTTVAPVSLSQSSEECMSNSDDYLTALTKSSQAQLRDFLSTADTTLLCGEDKIPVRFHAATLSWWSTVMRDLLKDLNVAGTPEQPAILTMAEDDARGWAFLQEMMYPVRPQAKVRHDNVKAVMVLAHKYNISRVVKETKDFIQGASLSVYPGASGYVLTWLQLADEFRLENTVNRCVQFIHAHSANKNITGPLSSMQTEEAKLTSRTWTGIDLTKLRPETLAKLLKATLLPGKWLCASCGVFVEPSRKNAKCNNCYHHDINWMGVCSHCGQRTRGVKYTAGYTCAASSCSRI